MFDGRKLRSLREAKGVGSRELAYQVNINPAYLSQLETGYAKSPSYNLTCLIADRLGGSIEDFRTEPTSLPQ